MAVPTFKGTLDVTNTDLLLHQLPYPTWPPFTSKTQWSQLSPWNRHNFRYDAETTPFGNLSFLLVAWVVYHVVIWSLERMFRDRERWPAKAAAALHNLNMCIFSAIMFFGLLNDTIAKLQTDGWRKCVCAANFNEVQGPLWYWSYIYYISKYPELLDTVLLAVKKRPMSFLHVYHHTIVIFMVWIWFSTGIALGSFGVLANTFIHIIMYFHYFLTSLGHQVRAFKIFVTRAQIMQFVWSFIGSLPFLYYAFGFGEVPADLDLVASGGWGCLGKSAFLLGSVINASFLYLFVQFYSKTYQSKKAKKA